MSGIDPFAVTTAKEDIDKLKALDFFGQLDAAVNHVLKPQPVTLIMFVAGGIWWCINAAVCVGLTLHFSGAGMWTSAFHEALLKNAIAYDGIAHHVGFGVFIGLTSPEFKIKWMLGSIKEPGWPVLGRLPLIGGHRRTVVDMLGHLTFDLARVWLIISPEPPPACGWLVLGTAAWMYLFDFGEYVGMYGMYHGPWSVFIVAKYCTDQPTAATSVIQFLLILLYLGCGLGKLGPWFVAVFSQEWTLPMWAKLINLKRLLYNKDYPRDNSPTVVAKLLAYTAALVETVSPLALFATASIVGAEVGSASPYVLCGVITLIAMHIYILFHMPSFDVWMMNCTPAYLVYNVFYRCETLLEPGFDYSGFTSLNPVLQGFCCCMALYCLYGQLRPEDMTYMHCYRFWAGNWPQAWVLVSESGMNKIKEKFPVQSSKGTPGKAFEDLVGQNWALDQLGQFQTAQLPHRAIPMALHKAMMKGAELRGEKPPQTLLEFQDDGKGLVCFGSLFFGWYSGWVVNDMLRGRYVMDEMHKECTFEAGELMLIDGASFPLFAPIYGGKSHWFITDAKLGKLDEGYLTVDEALAITKPSDWTNYDLEGDRTRARRLSRCRSDGGLGEPFIGGSQ
eukprot:TRINITY_DN48820_c0_g1_i1.p1 TRINITY_DN48820_c0_g1~~TRINITY_DN48820_c0_g1_i1.p1  ORF type:complete len:634 (-),score=91.04 TRINITY_DN48820_c0_g1_i1:29-1882(-)